MPRPKRYWYECVMECDLGYWGPDQREERAIHRGRSVIHPRTLHSVRLHPSPGYNARGEELPADYAVFDKPLGRQYTEEIVKRVSRPKMAIDGSRDGRIMREKVSKIKFRLLDPEEIGDYVRRHAYDFGEDWHESLFVDATQDVHLPDEEAKMAAAGEKLLSGKAD